MTRIDRDTGQKIGRLTDYSNLMYHQDIGATYDNLKPNVEMCCNEDPAPENPVLPYSILRQAKTHISLVVDKQTLSALPTGTTKDAAPFCTVECGAIFWFGLVRSIVDPIPSLTGLYLSTTVTPGLSSSTLTKIWPLSAYTSPTWTANDQILAIATDWFAFRTNVTKQFYEFLQNGAVFESQLFGPAGGYGLAFQTSQTLNDQWSNVTNGGVVKADVGKMVLRTGFPDRYPTVAQEAGFYTLQTVGYGPTPNSAPSSNTVNVSTWWSGDPLDPVNLPTFYTNWSVVATNLGTSFSCGVLNYLTGGVSFAGVYRNDWWKSLNFLDSNPPRLHD